MNVGEYVRTKYGIALIENIKDDTRRINLKTNEIYIDKEYQLDVCIIPNDEGNSYFCGSEDIIKSSPNIIDLIEVGDFITYKKGNMYINIPYRVYETYNEILEETELRIDDEYLKDIEILSIVTREQFSQMEYKVGE